MSRRRWAVLVAAVMMLGVSIGVAAWAQRALGPMPEAEAALQSDERVAVEMDRWLAFVPTSPAPPTPHASSTGIVLYPGGRVDPRSYAPVARALAQAGHLAVVVPMPLNLAVLGADRATDVMAAYPFVERWVLVGHSLGGAMAAQFARDRPESVAGLVLLAAYPPSGSDLSGMSLPVRSLYGTRDGIATPDEVLASRPQLPATARMTAIEGGNHAQFGWYGPQDGDNEATISREQQQARVVAEVLDLARALGSPKRGTPDD